MSRGASGSSCNSMVVERTGEHGVRGRARREVKEVGGSVRRDLATISLGTSVFKERTQDEPVSMR